MIRPIAPPTTSVAYPEAAPPSRWPFVAPVAGLDYPTESPPPDFKVLVLPGRRLPAADLAGIQSGRPGVDFPTDAPPRDVLVRANGQRVVLESPIAVVPPVAGVDYPTDGPPRLDRETPVMTWSAQGEGFRARLNELARIEPAKAGVDYPTDSPGNPGWYVVVVRDAEGEESRLPLSLLRNGPALGAPQRDEFS